MNKKASKICILTGCCSEFGCRDTWKNVELTDEYCKDFYFLFFVFNDYKKFWKLHS